MMSRFATTLAALLALNSLILATEPNETFSEATVLAPGVLSVVDELTLGGGGNFPNTLIGIKDLFGEIYFTAPGSAGVGNAPTNSGSIDFSITGLGDDDFIGSHNESGQYEVFVRAYDFFDDLVDSFSEVRTLAPGEVHDFSFSDFEWINGSYDVYVDNPAGGGPSDIDFFTFTGLAPFAPFAARTVDTGASGIDTYLGLFSSSGFLQETNDDEDFNSGIYTSLIEGNVPASGTLTFAVTGFGDENFIGNHSQSGPYELRLDVETVGLAGDYNNNGKVDAADYVAWRKDPEVFGGQQGYNDWRANFGRTASAASRAALTQLNSPRLGESKSAVPEPSAVVLTAFTAAALAIARRRAALP